MPMPHRTQMQVIKRRLTGKEGRERTRELQQILADLPNYKNGPYGDIRRWVMDQIDESRVRTRAVHRDSIAVRREGAAQIALVGAPNAGKSSLLHALSEVQIKIGNYAFTTLRPVPALVRIGGVLVQLVEIPGLIEGATEDRGGGRALLGVLRGADAIVFCHDITQAPDSLLAAWNEVQSAGIELPAMLALTKADEADQTTLVRMRDALRDLPAVSVSILDDASLIEFKEAIWRLTGLIRVFLRRNGRTDSEPLALERGASVVDVAASVHKELAAAFRGARVWGSSARFDGQQVGRDHRVIDGDTVEILT